MESAEPGDLVEPRPHVIVKASGCVRCGHPDGPPQQQERAFEIRTLAADTSASPGTCGCSSKSAATLALKGRTRRGARQLRPSRASRQRVAMSAPDAEAGDALCAAVRAGDEPAVSARLDAARTRSLSLVDLRDADGHTALHWASINASLPLLEALLAFDASAVDAPSLAQVQHGQTPLHWACVGGSVDAAVTLLDKYNADASAADERGYTALTHAVHYGHLDLCHVVLEREPKLLHVSDEELHTPLHWAAYFGHHRVVIYMLVVHAPRDIDARDAAGHTPLHRATQRNHDPCARALIAAGADVNVRDADGRTPLDLAAPRTRLREGLLRAHRAATTSPRSLRAVVQALPSYWFVIIFHVLVVVSYERYVHYARAVAPRSVYFDILLHVLLITAVSAADIATLTQPGYLPRGTPADFTSRLDAAIRARTMDRDFDASRYCFACLAPRPPRSRHSRVSDRCIARFDHQCPFVNNEVGLRNHRSLVLYATSIAPAQWMFIYACVAAFRIDAQRATSVWPIFRTHWSLMVVLAAHALLSAFASGLFCTQLRLICLGRTTFEDLTNRRTRTSQNPYDRGCWNNVVAFLTMTGPGTDIAPPVPLVPAKNAPPNPNFDSHFVAV